MQKNSSMVKSSNVSSKPRRRKPQGARVYKPVYNRPYMSGHGNYTYNKPGPVGKAGRWVGGALGRYFAGSGGEKLGGAIGGLLHYPAKLFGSGDYEISPSKPLSYNTLVNSTQIPDFISYKNDFIRIKHHEYIGDIYTSATIGAFDIQSFPLNPGLSATFPYLGELTGGMFQQYRLNGVLFSYCSRSSDALNSTNTALGSVILATEYDSLDAEFVNRQEMENSQYSVSCKPSQNCVHGIECARNQTSVSELYMRSGAVPSGGDIRLYDHARFSIATQGFQAASINIGSLYITYDISFLKPIQPPPGFFTKQTMIFLSSPADATPLGGATITYDTYDAILAITNTTITFDPDIMVKGSILQVQYMVRGVSTASVESDAITGSNGLGTVQLYLNRTSSGYQGPAVGESQTTTTSQTTYVFKYSGGGTQAAPPTLTWATAATLPGATVSGQVLITLMNPILAA